MVMILPTKVQLLLSSLLRQQKNQLLHIECRAWAKNIGYSKRDRVGINHLELLVLGNEGAKKVGSGS
jgi:hypothetical protein